MADANGLLEDIFLQRVSKGKRGERPGAPIFLPLISSAWRIVLQFLAFSLPRRIKVCAVAKSLRKTKTARRVAPFGEPARHGQLQWEMAPSIPSGTFGVCAGD